MNKIKFFVDTICQACSQMRIEQPLLWKDNRLGKNYVASVLEGHYVTTDRKRQVMRYNAKLIKQMPKPDIIHAVLHELGHIKTKYKTKIEAEYKAEKFALKAMKKYYPRHYQRAIKYLKQAQYFNNSIYRKAFKKLVKELK